MRKSETHIKPKDWEPGRVNATMGRIDRPNTITAAAGDQITDTTEAA